MNSIEIREARIKSRRLEYYAKGNTLRFDEATSTTWLCNAAGDRVRPQPNIAKKDNVFTVWYDPQWLSPERLSRLEALCWLLDERRQRFWQKTYQELYVALLAAGGMADWVSPSGAVMRYYISYDALGYQFHPVAGWITSDWLKIADWAPGPRDAVLHRELGDCCRRFLVEDGPRANTILFTISSILDEAIRRECARRWPSESIIVGQNVRLMINDRPYFYAARRYREEPGAVMWTRIEWPLFGQWDSAVIS